MAAIDIAAMARRVADDGDVPIRDRQLAANVLHAAQHRLPIDATAAWRVRVVHGRRAREVRELAQHWLGATG